MKTRLFLVAIMLIGLVATTNAKPKTKVYDCKSVEQVKKKIKTSFQSVPFNEIDCNETCCTVNIYFRFDESGQLDVQKVTSRNKQFVEYVEKKLDEHVYSLKEKAPETMYMLKVTFIRES